MLGPTIPAEQPAQTNPLLKSPQTSAAPLNVQHTSTPSGLSIIQKRSEKYTSV